MRGATGLCNSPEKRTLNHVSQDLIKACLAKREMELKTKNSQFVGNSRGSSICLK